eukprot:5159765-Alexandrium_andersonii.AAC.1
MDEALTDALKEGMPMANQKVGATSRAAGRSSAAASEASSDWFAPLPGLSGSRKRAASSAATSSSKRRKAAGANAGADGRSAAAAPLTTPAVALLPTLRLVRSYFKSCAARAHRARTQTPHPHHTTSHESITHAETLAHVFRALLRRATHVFEEQSQ